MKYYTKDSNGDLVEIDSSELTISTTDEFVTDEQVENVFSIKNKKTDEQYSIPGCVNIQWLSDMATKGILKTQQREYQREQVAPVEWCQGIIDTILFSKFAKVPQLHIRVLTKIVNGNLVVYSFELVDGQQRSQSAIIDFITNKFPIGGKTNFPNSLHKGTDLSGVYFKDLKLVSSDLYYKFEEYIIQCLWYGNLTDDDTSDLFIEVLNNVNSICAQEKRNAVRGRLTRYIRDKARDGGSYYDLHQLFNRIIIKGKTKLQHFGPFKLNNKMEVDEWLAELCYLKTKDWINGVSSASLTNWYKETQKEGAVWNLKGNESEWKKEEKEFDDLLDFAYELMNQVSDSQREKLTPNPSLVFILYAYELKNKYGKLQIDKYIEKFFKTWKDWSSITLQKWVGKHFITKHGNISKEILKPFDELFTGTATKSMATIKWVLGEAGDYKEYGAIKLDGRSTFSKKVKDAQYDEQNGKCYYTGLDVPFKDKVGDHFIPLAWGVELGGVTEPSNCRITNKTINNLKDDKSPEDFAERLSENGYTLTEEFKKDLKERENEHI